MHIHFRRSFCPQMRAYGRVRPAATRERRARSIRQSVLQRIYERDIDKESSVCSGPLRSLKSHDSQSRRRHWLVGTVLSSPLHQQLLSFTRREVYRKGVSEGEGAPPVSPLYRWVSLPGRVMLPRCRTGRGWASVLNTQFSRGSSSSLEKSRYRYLQKHTRKDCKINRIPVPIQVKDLMYPIQNTFVRNCSVSMAPAGSSNDWLSFHSSLLCKSHFQLIVTDYPYVAFLG